MNGSATPARSPISRIAITVSAASALGVAMTGLMAVPADAAIAQVYNSGTTLNFQANGGETNNVTIAETAPGVFTFTDSGAELGAGADCTSDAGVVTCTTSVANTLYVYLGDGDDTVVVDVDIPVQFEGAQGDDDITTLGTRNAYLNGGPGDDVLTSGAGNDQFQSSEGSDTISGGAGNDTSYAYGGDTGGGDTIDMGPGNDYVYPGIGNDDVRGGSGTDTISYGDYYWDNDYYLADVHVSLDDIGNDGRLDKGEIDNVHADFENIITFVGNDTIVGNDAANVISTSNGDDTVSGGGGKDTISTESGNDTIDGGSGNDRLTGGPDDDAVFGEDGDDWLDGSDNLSDDSFSGGDGVDFIAINRTGDVTVTLDNEANDGEAGETDNVMSDVEDVVTGAGDDTIVGAHAANDFSGGAGNDIIRGGGGNDGIDGGLGRDTLGGGPGTDSIAGGGNSDTIRTKDAIADYITCGSSIDTLIRDMRDQVAVDCELVS